MADLEIDEVSEIVNNNIDSNLKKIVQCWGLNDSGQTDVPIAFKSGINLVAAGEGFTCGASVKYAQCWGESLYNKLNTSQTVPISM